MKCSMCNDPLVRWDGEEERLVAVKRCYATNYGLVCQKCLDKMLETTQKAIDVYADWREGEHYDWPY